MKKVKNQMAKNRLEIHHEPPPNYGNLVFHKQITSDLSLKNPVIDEILAILKSKANISEDDQTWIRLCLDEVLVNAIRHGNREDKEKQVTICLFAGENSWAVRVEDEGEGFAIDQIPQVDDKEYWELEHGRGIMLIQSYMDEIWYYDKGNRVQLSKIHQKPWKKLWNKILCFLKLKA